MLESMRTAAQGVIGRAVMAVVMGLIIVSFVIWGVGDMLRGFTATTIATVGSAKITAQDYRSTLQQTLRQYQQMMRRNITNADARAMGIDQQVLENMISESALDERAKAMGLAISTDTLVKAVRGDKRFQGADGQFDPRLFAGALQNMGVGEQQFFVNQRRGAIEGLIETALTLNVAAPKAMTEIESRYESQARGVDYLVLPPAAAGDIPAPSDEAMKAYFNERKAEYRAPERRAMTIIDVEPETLAKPGEVSDEEARALYEKEKDTRFGSPEKRKLQQIVFPDEAAATEAAAKIKAGTSFDEIAKTRGLAPADLDIGETTKSAMFDKAVAEAAFALPQPGVTDAVKGEFGWAIVRVESIAPGSIKPYAEVAETVKRAIAAERAVNDVQAMHDKIEDLHVSGKSFAEIAKALSIEAQDVPPVDAQGRDANGGAPNLPDKGELLRSVFASDIGVDNEALQTKARGYVWFEVTKVEPSHERAFEEARPEVEKALRAEDVDKALAAKAADLVKQLQGGATLASLASGAGLEAKSAADIRRAGSPTLADSVVAAIFRTPPDGAGSASGPDGRVVFKITSDRTPPVDFADPRVKDIAKELDGAMRENLLAEYVAALRRELGVTVNQSLLQAAEGG